MEALAAAVGKDLRIDPFNASKGEFARASVEVDLSKPLLDHIWMDNKRREVKYEGLDFFGNQVSGSGNAREGGSRESSGGGGNGVNEKVLTEGKEVRRGIMAVSRGEEKSGWVQVHQKGQKKVTTGPNSGMNAPKTAADRGKNGETVTGGGGKGKEVMVEETMGGN